MDSLDRTAGLVPGDPVFWRSADGMVEDKEPRGTSAVPVNLIFILILDSDVSVCLHVFEQLLCLWVILCSDLLLVKEVLQFALVAVVLESMTV